MSAAQSTVATNEIAAAKERIEELRREVSRAYIGSPKSLDLMLVALLARGHVLLEGVPGVAKTTLVKAFAVALGCNARRIQFTPDLLPADITGTYVLSPKDGTFTLRAGTVSGSGHAKSNRSRRHVSAAGSADRSILDPRGDGLSASA